MTRCRLEEIRAAFADRITLWGGIPFILLCPDKASFEEFRQFIDELIEAIATRAASCWGSAIWSRQTLTGSACSILRIGSQVPAKSAIESASQQSNSFDKDAMSGTKETVSPGENPDAEHRFIQDKDLDVRCCFSFSEKCFGVGGEKPSPECVGGSRVPGNQVFR
jgi:hypothetical protein